MDIVYVDGFKIRNTLDDDFGLLHFSGRKISDYYSKWYIPEGEVWIDGIAKAETDFLLKIEQETDKYLAANSQKESSDYRSYMKGFYRKGPIPNFIKDKKTENGLTICYVDGPIVRQYLDPYFIFGGHDLVYDYVPFKEIWLDALTDPQEIKYILLHERVERDLMEKGKDYDNAHRFATAADMEERVKDGLASYPEDENYKCSGFSNGELIKNYVIERR